MTRSNSSTPVHIDPVALKRVCDAFRVRWLAVFGSLARGEQRPGSDADLLDEFEEGTRATRWTVAELAEALSSLFGGRAVDLGSPDQLIASAREQVLAEAVVIYHAQ